MSKTIYKMTTLSTNDMKTFTSSIIEIEVELQIYFTKENNYDDCRLYFYAKEFENAQYLNDLGKISSSQSGTEFLEKFCTKL